MSLPSNLFRPPFWCWGLANWEWKRSDGQRQGFARLAEDPGLANLFWVALGGVRPKDGFDIRHHPFIMLVHAKAGAKIDASGQTLEQWCATHTLEEFTHIVSSDVWLTEMVRIAKGLLKHADT